MRTVCGLVGVNVINLHVRVRLSRKKSDFPDEIKSDY